MPFALYELRTQNQDEARAFYSKVAGLAFKSGGSAASFVAIAPVPERAAARGVPPHWLGHVHVPDVEAAAAAFVSAGAERVGPTLTAADGERFAVLRDPSGAIVAVTSRRPPEEPRPVAWHQLHTTDRTHALALYGGAFGWTGTKVVNVPTTGVPFQLFAERGSQENVGSMADTVRLPHIHPHWLFFFSVPDIDRALESVKALGGRVLDGPHHSASGGDGRFVSPCEDSQGAAFGLSGPRKGS